jgi:hypothetical protein
MKIMSKYNLKFIHFSFFSDLDDKFIDFNYMFEKLKDEPYLTGLAPRWIMNANSTSNYDTNKNKNEKKSYWADSNLILLDSKLENQLGFGRTFDLDDLEEYVKYIILKI